MSLAKLMRLANPVPQFVRSWHMRKVGDRLAKFGLCYHDAIVETPALLQAISRLPEEMQEARLRRIRRAFDLSLKKQYLPEDQREDPWKEYDMLEAILQETQYERDERSHLNDEPWFTLGGAEMWYEYDIDNAWFHQGIADKKPPVDSLPGGARYQELSER